MKRLFSQSLFVFALSFFLAGNVQAQNIAVPEELGVTLDGKTFSLKDHIGKENLYLVFWTTWCGVCETEIPTFRDIHENLKDVRLIAINPGINDSLQRTVRYRDKHSLSYPIVFDASSRSAEAFDIVGVPTVIIISKDGEVLYSGFPLPREMTRRLLEER